MSLIDRILGRTPSTAPQITATPATNAAPPTAKPAALEQLPTVSLSATVPPARPAGQDVIRVYDQFGRKVEVGREAWRRDVLLPNLQAQRDNPDALYELVVTALDDGFEQDLLEPARHLAATDPQPRRGAAILAAVLLALGDAQGARELLENAIARHGRDPYLLANLARAHAALGDEARAIQLIWESLALDPNDEATLGWLIARLQSQGGAAVHAAFARAATLPGSWRAQLWLARLALDRGDVAEATRLYEEALARAGSAPADLLVQMSGDLGNRGQAALLIRLTQPHFDIALHGLLVGNNLLRAYVELGRFAEARKLLEQLYALQRPDWREHLLQWEEKLDDAEKRYGVVTGPLEVVVVKLDQPVWARGALGFESLLPVKSPSAPRVHFVCGSGEAADDTAGKVVSQPTNELGRLTRSLPMFLMEELQLRTHARTAFLLPWMKQGGFVLSAKPWTPAFLPPDHVMPDLVVFLHVDARATPWLLRVTIENLQRPATPVVFERAYTPETASEDILALLHDVVSRLTILLALRREGTDESLATPPQELLPGYLAGLEQALAVGLAARQAEGNFLHQERAIFDHLFDVALYGKDLLRPRLLLVNALEYEARRRKDIVVEYLDKLNLLQRSHALPAGRGADLLDKGVATVADRARA